MRSPLLHGSQEPVELGYLLVQYVENVLQRRELE
jgi:hypothetical protein